MAKQMTSQIVKPKSKQIVLPPKKHIIRPPLEWEVKGSLFETPNQYPDKHRRERWSNQPASYDVMIANDDDLDKYSRLLYGKHSYVHSAVEEVITNTFEDAFNVSYAGLDDTFGKEGLSWWNEYKNICYITGKPITFNIMLAIICRNVIVSGRALVVKVRTPDGGFFFRIIERHAIGARNHAGEEIKSGKYKGAKMKPNGNIVDRYGNVLAYHIMFNDNPEDDEDIANADCWMVYCPKFASKTGGFPVLAPVLRTADTAEDINRLLLELVQTEVSRGGLIINESGEFEDDSDPATPEEEEERARSKTAIEYDEGVQTMIARAGTGAKIESYKTDRPNSSALEFLSETDKKIITPLWPYQLLIKPEIVNGAPFRGAVMKRANKILNHWHETIAPFALDFFKWALANAQIQGFVSNNMDGEWYKGWNFSRHAELTADEAYDRQCDLADVQAGIKSADEVIEKRGKRGQDVRKANLAISQQLFSDAEALKAKHPWATETLCLEYIAKRNANFLPPQTEETPAAQTQQK